MSCRSRLERRVGCCWSLGDVNAVDISSSVASSSSCDSFRLRGVVCLGRLGVVEPTDDPCEGMSVDLCFLPATSLIHESGKYTFFMFSIRCVVASFSYRSCGRWTLPGYVCSTQFDWEQCSWIIHCVKSLMQYNFYPWR